MIKDPAEFLKITGLRYTSEPEAFSKGQVVYDKMKSLNLFSGTPDEFITKLKDELTKTGDGMCSLWNIDECFYADKPMQGLSSILIDLDVSIPDYEDVMSSAQRGYLDEDFRFYKQEFK